MKPLPENWLEDRGRYLTPRSESKWLEGCSRGGRKTIARKKADRAVKTPSDIAVSLHFLYQHKQKQKKLWGDISRTYEMLELSRNPNLAISDIAKLLNERFNEKRFSRNRIISRLYYLRALEAGRL